MTISKCKSKVLKIIKNDNSTPYEYIKILWDSDITLNKIVPSLNQDNLFDMQNHKLTSSKTVLNKYKNAKNRKYHKIFLLTTKERIINCTSSKNKSKENLENTENIKVYKKQNIYVTIEGNTNIAASIRKYKINNTHSKKNNDEPCSSVLR